VRRGATERELARRERVTRQTVGRWRARFVTRRLDRLLDEPRPGAPRKITDEAVERVVRDLETAIRCYVELTNGHAEPFVWTKTADQILDSVARFCHRISNSGH
jgi:transposase